MAPTSHCATFYCDRTVINTERERSLVARLWITWLKSVCVDRKGPSVKKKKRTCVHQLLWPLNITSHVWSYSCLPSEPLSCAPFANLSHLIRAEEKLNRTLGDPRMVWVGKEEKKKEKQRSWGEEEEKSRRKSEQHFRGHEWNQWFAQGNKWGERTMCGLFFNLE